MSENNKDVRISTYVDIDKAIELKQVCKLENKTIAEFVREIVYTELDRRNAQ